MKITEKFLKFSTNETLYIVIVNDAMSYMQIADADYEYEQYSNNENSPNA